MNTFIRQRMKADTYRVVQKIVSHYRIINKSYLIVLKPTNEIRFISKLKVLNKYYNITTWY